MIAILIFTICILILIGFLSYRVINVYRLKSQQQEPQMILCLTVIALLLCLSMIVLESIDNNRNVKSKSKKVESVIVK